MQDYGTLNYQSECLCTQFCHVHSYNCSGERWSQEENERFLRTEKYAKKTVPHNTNTIPVETFTFILNVTSRHRKAKGSYLKFPELFTHEPNPQMSNLVGFLVLLKSRHYEKDIQVALKSIKTKRYWRSMDDYRIRGLEY